MIKAILKWLISWIYKHRHEPVDIQRENMRTLHGDNTR